MIKGKVVSLGDIRNRQTFLRKMRPLEQQQGSRLKVRSIKIAITSLGY